MDTLCVLADIKASPAGQTAVPGTPGQIAPELGQGADGACVRARGNEPVGCDVDLGLDYPRSGLNS
jgi:hypothetical protein